MRNFRVVKSNSLPLLSHPPFNNNQPFGTAFDNSASCNLTTESSVSLTTGDQNSWKCWNNTNSMQDAYSTSDLVSMVFHSQDSAISTFSSRDSPDSEFYPYLSLTYSTANSAPISELDHPRDTTYDYNTSIPLNFIINDIGGDLDSCWDNINGGANTSIPGCLNTTFNIPTGNYLIQLYTNDTSGTESYTERVFSVDTIGIDISITEPSGTKTSRTNIPINYSATGVGVACWYNVLTSIGGDTVPNTTLPSCSNTSFNVSIDGDYILNLYANNTYRTLATTAIPFTISTSNGNGGGSGGGGGNSNKETFEITPINAIVSIGEEKGLQAIVKNTGFVTRNKCKLVAEEDFQDYIEADQIANIAGGEIFEFPFILKALDQNVENTKINVECIENIKEEVPLDILVLGSLDISFNEISFLNEEEILIKYQINPTATQEKTLTFKAIDSEKKVIVELSQGISLLRGEQYLGEISMDLSNAENGLVTISVEDTEKIPFLEENIIYGNPNFKTGFTLFNLNRTNSYIGIILAIFLVILFFIIRRIWNLKKGHAHVKKSKRENK